MSRPRDLALLSTVADAHAQCPQPEALLAALGHAVQEAIGYRLLTVLVHDAAARKMRRIYSTRPDINPVGGSKPVTDSDWMKQVLVRGEPYIGHTAADLKTVFFDHEILASIGCGSVLNMPVVWSGTVLGSLNMLHGEGWYTEAHLPMARLFAQLAAPGLMQTS
jgi:hypothetical protein